MSTLPQSRVSAGVPTGGQYAAKQHAEAGVQLELDFTSGPAAELTTRRVPDTVGEADTLRDDLAAELLAELPGTLSAHTDRGTMTLTLGGCSDYPGADSTGEWHSRNGVARRFYLNSSTMKVVALHGRSNTRRAADNINDAVDDAVWAATFDHPRKEALARAHTAVSALGKSIADHAQFATTPGLESLTARRAQEIEMQRLRVGEALTVLAAATQRAATVGGDAG